MFDKKYFDEAFVRQFHQLGDARCSIVLHVGTTLTVRRIHEALDGYVLLEVFPDEGVNEDSRKARRKAGGADEVFWDRVAVPYEAISQVWLSVTELDKERMIGFER